MLVPVFLAGPLPAQQSDPDPNRLDLTREELEQLATDLEATAESPAYNQDRRAESRRLASVARTRLNEGDFRPGDRVIVQVRGEPELSDTFSVRASLEIDLPVVGAASLRGVLFSELEGHLTRHIGRLIHEPEVRAFPMIRLAVHGEVGQPGFYAFPLEVPLSEVLMQVGGPTANADLGKISVEREGDRLWEGDRLEGALAQGQTLRELRLRSGDRVIVGGRSGGIGGVLGRVLIPVVPAVLVSLLLGVF